VETAIRSLLFPIVDAQVPHARISFPELADCGLFGRIPSGIEYSSRYFVALRGSEVADAVPSLKQMSNGEQDLGALHLTQVAGLQWRFQLLGI
jgi:hypothetical protein